MWRAALVGIMVVTCARIVSTYPTLSATSDEPAHISTGMEWLQFHDYTYEPQHPPLARIAVALGPYLAGLRSKEHLSPPAPIFEEGNAILYSAGDAAHNLTLARLGTLPFLVLLAVATYAWGRRYFNEPTAVLACALLLSLPPILGHAALATLDIACAATVTLALYQFLRWLDDSSPRRCIVLACAIALAVLTKYSAIPFLACSFGGALLLKRPRLRLVSVAIIIFTVVVLVRIPLDFTEFFLGLRDLWRHNKIGHDAFLLGEFRTTGWWYFFPVVLAVKTPVEFLVLSLGGAAFAWRHFRTNSPRALTALFFCAILLFSLTSRIDIGVRHVLALYPLLALLAADLAVRAWHHSRRVAILPALLIAATLVESVQAHPDYLAHFNRVANALTGNHPETIVCDSDLDWGQDLGRLSRRLRELHAGHVSIGYFGSAPLDRAGLPPYQVLGHQDPVPGYIAVSVHYLQLEYARNGGYAWLRAYRPVERIGRTIDLYHLDTLP